MPSNMTRRFVAGTSALAMAAGVAVTMGVGAAGAAPGSAESNAGPWKITRSIDNVTPKQGDTITVLNTLKWTNANLPTVTALKDVHNSCLTYVPGSAKRNGGGLNPEVGADYVRINFSEVYSQYKDAMTFEVKYVVGANCARGEGLQSTVHMAGNLGSNQSPSDIGPTISIAKNVTSMTINQIDAPAVGKPVTVKARVAGSLVGDKVEFFDGQSPLGSGMTDAEGWAEFEWTPAAAGNKTIRAVYAATPFTTSSEASRDATVAQGNVVSNTLLSAAPAQVGRSSNLTATVSPAGGGGEVDFYSNGVLAGTAPVGPDSKAVASWTPTTAGNVQVSAFFRGRNGVAPSDTAMSVTVAAKPPNSVASETMLRVEGAPQVGVATNLIANVDPKNAGGTVTFSVNGVQIGEAPVNDSGVAVFAWTPDEAGFRDLKAVYSGAGPVDSSTDTTTTTVAPGNDGGGDGGGDGGAGSLGSLGGLFGSLGG